MAANTYDKLLDRSWDEIPEAVVLPVGSWLLRGRNAAFVAAKGEANPRVLFFYTPVEAMADVDGGELGALGDDYDFNNNQIVKTFWVESNRDWATVRSHLELHGLETGGGKSQVDSLKEFKGAEVIAFLDTKTFEDQAGRTRIDNDPTNFRAVE